MNSVLAAVDNSLAANPVMVTGRALARVLGARIEAVHVIDSNGAPRAAAEAVGVPLRVVSGPVVDQLIEAGGDENVVAVVIGARSTRSGGRPLGSTAFAVATSLLKPVVVVPPEGRIATALRRVLVPLEGTTSTSLAPRTILEVARGASLDVLALHVAGDDQPLREQEGWAREFLARYCPWGIGAVRLERRVGRTDELVPLVAEEAQADLIALGWTQQLESGRAPVVRAALERSRVPVMLVPVHVAAEALEGAAQ